MAFLVKLWHSFQLYIILALAGVALITGAYFYGKQEQRAETRAEQAEQRAKDIQKARKIENEIRELPDTDLDRKLDRWMRD
jgi:Flp pilus assembly protein TadB